MIRENSRVVFGAKEKKSDLALFSLLCFLRCIWDSAYISPITHPPYIAD